MQRLDAGRSGGRRRYVAVAQQLLAGVSQGLYKVGQALPSDRELALQFGVSRATVREALLALEFIGVLDIRHGAGTFVRGLRGTPTEEVSPLDVAPREVIESRQAIEPALAALVAEHIAEETLTAVQADLDEAADLVNLPEALPRFVVLGLRFHADLAIGCGNSVLAGIASSLVDVSEHPLWTLLNQQAMSSVVARQSQVDEHRSVLTAIKRRNASAAELAMREHLAALNRTILRPSRHRAQRNLCNHDSWELRA